MVPVGLIDDMKKEAKTRSKFMVYDQLCSDLESTERQLTLEKNSIKNSISNAANTNWRKTLNDGINKSADQRIKLLTEK